MFDICSRVVGFRLVIASSPPHQAMRRIFTGINRPGLPNLYDNYCKTSSVSNHYYYSVKIFHKFTCGRGKKGAIKEACSRENSRFSPTSNKDEHFMYLYLSRWRVFFFCNSAVGVDYTFLWGLWLDRAAPDWTGSNYFLLPSPSSSYPSARIAFFPQSHSFYYKLLLITVPAPVDMFTIMPYRYLFFKSTMICRPS